ncbi:MAG: DUF362 domain-containing protein [Limisphaerales bacterium]
MNTTYTHFCSRRGFIQKSIAAAAAVPFVGGMQSILGAEARAAAKVAVVECKTYGPAVTAAYKAAFDLLGGIGSLVNGRTVTVKLNLTGTNFTEFLGRPVGDTFMTHYDTAAALVSELFRAGAKRVRFVESTQSKATLEGTLSLADWDVNELKALGRMEFENTRNLGSGKSYAHLKVPNGGLMFSALDLNQSYAETDVVVSLCKLKQHLTAGITLSLKNMFGLTPNSLYGDRAGSEDATAGRGPIHNPGGFEHIKLPGLKDGPLSKEPTWRVPRTIVDICAARPVHLAIIDGITSMSGGEGPWCAGANTLEMTKPGILIAGLNPVSTDAVGTALMGYSDPRAARGTKPFHFCDNHLVLAEQAGLGSAELAKIEVVGLPISKARLVYKDLA